MSKLHAGFTMLFLILLVAPGPGGADAKEIGSLQGEIEPYLKLGSIAWDENGGVGGHKFLVAGGLNTDLTLDSWGGILKLEKWVVSEGLDDDRNIIAHEGYTLSGGVRYRFITVGGLLLDPYTLIGYDKWKRKGVAGDWRSMTFFSGTIGLRAGYRQGYAKIGFIIPFSPDTDRKLTSKSTKAKPGIEAEAGIHFNILVAGLFYRHIGIEDPDAKMTQSGIMFGLRFK